MDIRNTKEYKSGNFHIVTCPICKNETLDMHFICEHCGWEYDYTSDENEESSANGMTIREYRAAYLKYPAKCGAVKSHERLCEIHEAIINLLHSPELKEFSLKNPLNLNADNYASIIAGAPIGIIEKKILLTRLADNSEISEDCATIKRYIAALKGACESLYGKCGKHGFLAITLHNGCNSDDDNKIDGPYYASTIEKAQKAIRAYRKDYSNDDLNWNCLYWEIEQFYEGAPSEYCGFIASEYTFIADGNGKIQYFLHRTENGAPVFSKETAAFGNHISDLDIPVPYRPGDILEIDCSPYTCGPHYCRLTEVRGGCCGVWCIFPDEDGKPEGGALKHGHYFANAYKNPQYLSPLYHARVYKGKLPEKYRIINQELSKAEEE